MNAIGRSMGTEQRTGGWPSLVLLTALCFLAAAVGGVATASSVGTWYPELNKPSWNPPDAVFGPVWTVLYATMAVAAWIVWRRRGVRDVRTAMVLFAGQLILNVAWSFLFFGLREPGFAFAEIVVLWLAIAGTVGSFSRISSLAAWMLVPYLAWVSFAACLNFAIWRLNP